MKVKRIAKRLLSIAVVLVIISTMTLPALAATTGAKTMTGTMSLYLNPNQRGTSTQATIVISGLPANAVVTKITIDANTMSYSGAIVSEKCTLSSSNISKDVTNPWGSGNKTVFTAGVLGSLANGTYKVSYDGWNASSLSSGYKTYSSVKFTLEYA